ncbi:septal ring lytic transglycosylase RlpA family protein [bacterium]|nr:septal ring lytic transglycosylase RlpA family protein [bacterium]
MTKKNIKGLFLIILTFFFSCSPNAIYKHGLETNEALTENPEIKTKQWEVLQTGFASFYANKFEGRKTANGEIFRQTKLTAAHKDLPFGTVVKVTNLENGKFVVVKINDRFVPKKKRCIDLTKAAAKELGFIEKGIAKVNLEILR